MQFLFDPFIFRTHLGPERSEKVATAVRLLVEAYGDFNHPAGRLFAGDNLIASERAMSFFADADLIRAMRDYARHPAIADLVEEPQVYNHIWRHHIMTSLARSALRLPGDICEFGVYIGETAFIVRHYLGSAFDRRYWLYDAFDHEKVGLPSQRGPAHGPGLERQVRALFADWQDMEIVAGPLPETLVRCPTRICFAHVDLNDAVAENAVTAHIVDRMPPGGIILFDDYGWADHGAQRTAIDRLLQGLGMAVTELPTGQGLAIRH